MKFEILASDEAGVQGTFTIAYYKDDELVGDGFGDS
jgi:hypothetical protein